jgi:hypothetical protein
MGRRPVEGIGAVMVAKYGTGTYGTDVYSFGYTTFAGTVLFAPALSGNLLKTLVVSGTLSAAVTLKGNLNRAGVQNLSGTLVAAIEMAVPVFSVGKTFGGTLTPDVVLSAAQLRNVVKRLSGMLQTDITMFGHFGRDRFYAGMINPVVIFAGKLFARPTWEENPEPIDPWVPGEPGTGLWVPIDRPTDPWNTAT